MEHGIILFISKLHEMFHKPTFSRLCARNKTVEHASERGFHHPRGILGLLCERILVPKVISPVAIRFAFAFPSQCPSECP